MSQHPRTYVVKELQSFVNDMAESVQHMNLKGRNLEMAKAAIRAAISYANQKRSRNQESTPPLSPQCRGLG